MLIKKSNKQDDNIFFYYGVALAVPKRNGWTISNPTRLLVIS